MDTPRYDNYVYPRAADLSVVLGGEMPDTPVVSVSTDGTDVYVQVGHEDVGSVVIRMAGHIARQVGWSLSAAAVEAAGGTSAHYVLTGKGREALYAQQD